VLTKENHTKVKDLRKRINDHIERIREIDAEIKAWEKLKQHRLSLITVDLAQLDEISNDEIPENN
jgi:flagellar biosynthesis chaperone FliJ